MKALGIVPSALRMMDEEDFEVRPIGWEDLPPELREKTQKALDDGIFYKIDMSQGFRNRKVAVIRWCPGDPNPLAAAIIEKVHGRIGLDLDGHEYWIEPKGERDGRDQQCDMGREGLRGDTDGDAQTP